MARQEEQRHLNRRRDQSFGRNPERNFDSMNQDRDWGYDQNRHFDDRSVDSDYDARSRGTFSDYRSSGGDYYGPSERANEWDARTESTYSSNRYGEQRKSGGAHFGKGPKGWKRSDERIKEEACEALYRDSEIDASSIDVTVEEGCICLRGNVDSRQDKKRAEQCVENLSGVDDVRNELRVGSMNSKNNDFKTDTNVRSSNQGSLS